MLDWFLFLAICVRVVSGTDVHLILGSDLSDQEVQWSIDYIEQSFTDGLNFNVHVRKLKQRLVNLSNLNRWKSLLSHGSMVIFAFKDSFLQESLILEHSSQSRRTGTFLIWFGEENSSIPDSISQMNSHFCNDGSIKLPVSGTKRPINEMIVDPLTMWNVLKPSNIPDYLSLCYGISEHDHEDYSKLKNDWKTSCHYGVLDDEGKCLCIEGFEGSRCQISVLTQLDCDDGFASLNSNRVPVCNCNSPVGGFQYCGADPCHGTCLGECSKWKSGIECDTSLPTKSIDGEVRPSGKVGAVTTTSTFSSQTATASTTGTILTTAATTTSTTKIVITDDITSTASTSHSSITSEAQAITTVTATTGDITTISEITTTTTRKTSSSKITSEAVVSTVAPSARRIDNLECGDHGRNSGNNCICFDGYRGFQCQIPPIDLVCDNDRIQVTLSVEYAKYMAKYYLENGSFFICQNEDDCMMKNCSIESTFEHSWEQCQSIMTRTGQTLTVQNNVFWKLPKIDRFVQVGKYECIYQSKTNINPASIMSTCCRKSWSRIYGKENIIVKPVLWKLNQADGSYEQLLDPTSWVVNEPVIVKLDVSDIFKREIDSDFSLKLKTCSLTDSEDLSTEKITNLVVIQNGCPTAYSERIGLKILNEEGSVGFQFDAFNWKNGGQVYVHCNYDACQGEECKVDTCSSSRLRRETISLKANIVGHGHISKGPIVARSNPEDVITIQDYQFFGFLNLGIGIVIGMGLCFAIFLLIRTIKNISGSKKPSKKQS